MSANHQAELKFGGNYMRYEMYSFRIECPKCHKPHNRLWCERCGAAVPPSALLDAKCPNCGTKFKYWKCYSCGYKGKPGEFVVWNNK